MADSIRWIVEAAIAQARTRASWNERLAHWERPPSDHEEGKIQRAAGIAIDLVSASNLLIGEGVRILPQGSYFNNTNVRLEADMDLRVQLPGIMVRYADDVDQVRAENAADYNDTGRRLADVASSVRDELTRICRLRFGKDAVDPGNKAIAVAGLDGSRADVDLVPAFHFHWITNDPSGGFWREEGVAIVSKDGTEILNFPDQHHANGIAKRNRTKHRFKKVVRMFKRLNYELCELGAITSRAPSFLCECLVYLVEDQYFLQDDDDRYGRLQRVVRRASELLKDPDYRKGATEINEIKFLFHPSQAWTLNDARTLLAAALVRLAA